MMSGRKMFKNSSKIKNQLFEKKSLQKTVCYSEQHFSKSKLFLMAFLAFF
jgi:hypothetical protein